MWKRDLEFLKYIYMQEKDTSDLAEYMKSFIAKRVKRHFWHF